MRYSSPIPQLPQATYLKRYDSTSMTEYTVEQDWRDRGINRPDIDDIHFDIMQNGSQTAYLDHTQARGNETTHLYEYTLTNPNVEGETYKAYLETEVADSNTYLYKYTVPEFAPDGSPYEYTSEQFFPDGLEEKYKTVLPTEEKPNTYLAIGLTELVCTIGFADKYLERIDHLEYRPNIDKEFIFEYSSLYRAGENQPMEPPPDLQGNFEKYFSIETDSNTGVTTLTIKRLEEISPEGNAITYYLQPKEFGYHYPLELPVNPETGTSPELPQDFQEDYYTLRGENIGIHTNEIDKIYDGGEMRFTLTGETEFTAEVDWDDKEHEQDRIAMGVDAAEFSIWRFVGGPENHDESALVEDHIPLDNNGEQNYVRKNNLAKYDVDGDLYYYYGVEHVDVNDLPYQITYSAPEHGEDSTEKLYNKGTVTNKLSQTVQYTVDAEWVAAARQGGNATATYVLERRQKNPDTGEYGDWAQVPPATIDGVDRSYVSKRQGY